ncbi:ubiquinol oxidase, mitochondrial-like [Papaver somniferum]|uniref:ubiquinol oxidase, mitochondrial-like n=1 Tax=Papaver somniferum TaxID=3469 RepID=UPI000E6FB4DC|nr:ubiquinol oxidase, mitochondrial-like [Papaver somniferum]
MVQLIALETELSFPDSSVAIELGIYTCLLHLDTEKALLEEAENGRMHLMTIVELVQLKWYEGFLVLTVEGVFFNAFFAMYLLSPMLTHTITSCLEEEAVHSYTKFLKEIDSGKIENVPDPAIAILLEATQRCKFKRCRNCVPSR